MPEANLKDYLLTQAFQTPDLSDEPNLDRSDIQVIPPEIWSYIFVHTLTQPPQNLPYGRPIEYRITLTDPRLAPMVIASVCRAWRQIACSTPELWESCWLSSTHPELNRMWLDRAGARPLTLYGHLRLFKQEIWHSMLSRSELPGFFESILPYRSRWKIINISIVKSLQQPSVPLPFKGLLEASILEKVELGTIALPYYTLPFDDSWCRIFTSSAPKLQSVKLFHVAPPFYNLFEFPELVDLELFGVTVDVALGALNKLPNIQTLCVLLVVGEGEIPHSFAPVTHKNLEHLHIQWSKEGQSQEDVFFDYLTLPALHNLHLERLDRSQQQVTAPIAGMVKRSLSRITHFKISDTDLDEIQLNSILQIGEMDASIETLELCGSLIPAALLRFLQYDPQQPHLPSLQHLLFKDCKFMGPVDGLLAAIIFSRNRPFVSKNNHLETGPVARQALLQSFLADLVRWADFLSDIRRITPINPQSEAVHWTGKLVRKQEEMPVERISADVTKLTLHVL